jgi:membrane protein
MSFAVLAAIFACLYKFLPAIKIPWILAWRGSLFSSVFFAIGKYLIGLYFAYSTIATSYGAAGTMIIFLFWIYYSAQVTLMGAVFMQAKRINYLQSKVNLGSSPGISAS